MTSLDWQQFDLWCAALCAWREARGEGRDGIRAVLHVIANRAALSGKSWAQVVFSPLQFSSMTYGRDPQLTKVPTQPDAQFADCFDIANAVASGADADLTNGATHYFDDSIAEPEWAKAMTEVASVGHFTFYKQESVTRSGA